MIHSGDVVLSRMENEMVLGYSIITLIQNILGAESIMSMAKNMVISSITMIMMFILYIPRYHMNTAKKMDIFMSIKRMANYYYPYIMSKE